MARAQKIPPEYRRFTDAMQRGDFTMYQALGHDSPKTLHSPLEPAARAAYV